ncbi:hypothetical protein [Novosphingobium marinum]|uniref:Glycosyltransferase RgtA/B/C/D-like domain-containing protein n=1 Tax=Novosphingobium marinum TaxID=1514948 RepID=A0A7Z0BW92_9SPHN|nr:hypothetical protein [Novosphingobium marinum]NYH96007.1 hypothetical protein [Novosphingobium marinum]
MESTAMRWLRTVVLAAFVAAIGLGMFVPVYSDEIGWRFQERAALDGVDKMFTELCGPNTLAAPPFFMMPVRWYSALFNTAFADPFWVRASGVLYALLLAAMLFAILRRVAANARERDVLVTLGIGMLCLGMTPLLLVWSRPEQPIALTVLSAVCLGLGGAVAGRETGRATAWLRCAAIVALVVVAASYHLKGLAGLPIFLAALFFCAKGREAHVPRIAAALLILGIAAVSASYWLDRLSCPGNAALRELYEAHSIGASISSVSGIGDLRALAETVFGNVGVLRYILLTNPDQYPLASWLPAEQVTKAESLRWYLSLVIVWSGVLLIGLVAFVAAAVRAWRARAIPAPLVFAVAALVSFVGWTASQNWSNIYETTFVIPLLLLAVLLSLATAPKAGRARSIFEVSAVGVGLLALVNVALLGTVWAPGMARAFGQAGYIEDQPLSVSIRGYRQIEPKILETGRMCGIPEPENARAVLVDELTYFAYMESRLPQHRLGAFSHWNGDLQDPVGYLKSRDSDGIVVGCHILPESLRDKALRNGRFCCLGPDQW